MGEIAESIINGEACQYCGEWLDDFLETGEGCGFPTTCGCEEDE